MIRQLVIVSAAIFLSGCQSLALPNSGAYHHGNEKLPAFFRYYHQLDQSNGHEFRGYRPVKKHWHFQG